MLAEVVRRVDGRPFEQYVREEIFLPLGMDDCWVGMPDRRGERGAITGTMRTTRKAAPVALDLLDSADTLAKCIPGGGGRPMRQPARLLLLLRSRSTRGVRISPKRSRRSPRHRGSVPRRDVPLRMRLGPRLVDNLRGGHVSPALATVARHVCHRPEHDLVVVVQTTRCADDHYRRLDEVMTVLLPRPGSCRCDVKGATKAIPQVQL